MSNNLIRCVLSLGALALAAQNAGAAEGVIRNGDAPGRVILSSVEIPASKNIVFLSGVVPPVVNPDAPAAERHFGDMETQATGVLTRIESNLKDIGLSMKDVVKAQVFLVADAATGQVDREGFNKAFAKFFGTEAQPNKPARSAFTIAGLGNPKMFIEIEVVAVRP